MATRKVTTAEEYAEVLTEPKVRIEYGIGFGTRGSVIMAHVEVGELGPGGRYKWTKVEPALVAPEEGGRAELTEQIAGLIRQGYEARSNKQEVDGD